MLSLVTSGMNNNGGMPSACMADNAINFVRHRSTLLAVGCFLPGVNVSAIIGVRR